MINAKNVRETGLQFCSALGQTPLLQPDLIHILLGFGLQSLDLRLQFFVFTDLVSI